MQQPPLDALHKLRVTLDALLADGTLDNPTIARALHALLRDEPLPDAASLGGDQGLDALYKLAWWLSIRGPAIHPRQLILTPMTIDLMLNDGRMVGEVLDDLMLLEEAQLAGELAEIGESPLITALQAVATVEHAALSGQPLRDHVRAASRLFEEHQASRDSLINASLDALLNDFTQNMQQQQHASPPAEDAPLPTPAAYVSRGQQQFEDGDIDLALRDFNRALQLDPNFAPALHNRALVFAAAADSDAALADLARVLQLHPDYTPALISRSQLHLAIGEPVLACEDLDAVLAIKPEHMMAFLLRSNARLQAGLRDEALSDINAAITLEPKTAMLYVQRATIRRMLGQDDQAEADFGKAIKLDNGCAPAFAGRGFLRMEHESWSAAEADLASAIRLDPNNPVHYYNRGNARIAQENVEGAIEDYTEALELDPDDIEARLNRGAAYFRLDDLESTLADWDAAIQIDPYHPAPYARRGTLMWVSEELEQAEADLTRALELSDDLWPPRHAIQQQLDEIRAKLTLRRKDKN
jgi:tetratricopeptide (TPR) repeat protein